MNTNSNFKKPATYLIFKKYIYILVPQYVGGSKVQPGSYTPVVTFDQAILVVIPQQSA